MNEESTDQVEQTRFYLEYSKQQDCFHIEALEDIIKINFGMFRKDTSNGYMIIYGPGTYEQMAEAAKSFRNLVSGARR